MVCVKHTQFGRPTGLYIVSKVSQHGPDNDFQQVHPATLVTLHLHIGGADRLAAARHIPADEVDKQGRCTAGSAVHLLQLLALYSPFTHGSSNSGASQQPGAFTVEQQTALAGLLQSVCAGCSTDNRGSVYPCIPHATTCEPTDPDCSS